MKQCMLQISQLKRVRDKRKNKIQKLLTVI